MTVFALKRERKRNAGGRLPPREFVFHLGRGESSLLYGLGDSELRNEAQTWLSVNWMLDARR